MNGNGSQSRSRQGFTLLELIVVVGIIIVLISILIPALSGSRMQAQIADTKSQLAGLSSGCEQYQQIFQAYPGPVTEANIVANNTMFTANQNLLIGLSRRSNNASVTGATTPLTGVGIYVDATGTNSPMDYSRNAPAGVPYDAVQFKASELFPAAGNKYSTLAAGTAFPVIVDHFKEAMPILYYRKIPGRTDMTSYTVATRAYELTSNAAFLGGDITSTIGSKYTQPAASDALYQKLLGNNVGGTWSPKGGYVLISAGPDHLYGTADDIIVSGGY